VRVDCSALKDALIGHCLQCQSKLTGLLNNNGKDELEDIFINVFQKTKNALTMAPTNLDDLSSKLTLCKDSKETLNNVQQRFEPLREIYATLAKFEVTVKEDELVRLGGLESAFEDYAIMISDAEKALDKAKVGMKRDLEIQMDGYSNQMSDLKTASQQELPFSNENRTPEEALAIIKAYKTKIEKAKEKENSLSNGFAIFAMQTSEHKDLSAVIRDVNFLTEIWEVTIDWNGNWDTWKNGQFQELNVEEMENVAGNFSKKVGKLGRDIKKWKVWESMKMELDRFRETLPLIQDLRNKAMRSKMSMLVRSKPELMRTCADHLVDSQAVDGSFFVGGVLAEGDGDGDGDGLGRTTVFPVNVRAGNSPPVVCNSNACGSDPASAPSIDSRQMGPGIVEPYTVE
jgi:dynein heavy chain